LHEGDLVSLVLENASLLNPLALQLPEAVYTAAEGRELLAEALESEPALLRCSSATFLEAAAVALGRPALASERRSEFEAVRSQDQRILEFPSTAGRVTSAVASPGTPLETYVAYVIRDADDTFLIGLTMLEFDRNAPPLLIAAQDLLAGEARGIGTFSRAVTLGGEEDLVSALPQGVVARVVTL
jgi:hypothetical protein